MEGLKNHVMHRQKVFQVEYSLNPHLSKVYVSYMYIFATLIDFRGGISYIIFFFLSCFFFGWKEHILCNIKTEAFSYWQLLKNSSV